MGSTSDVSPFCTWRNHETISEPFHFHDHNTNSLHSLLCIPCHLSFKNFVTNCKKPLCRLMFFLTTNHLSTWKGIKKIMNLERKNQFWSLPRYNSKDLTPKFLCWVSFLTKEQEETRSYISIPASPNASDAQIIPAERAVYTENNKIS